MSTPHGLIPKHRAHPKKDEGCRVELYATPDGWRLDLINHRLDRRSDGILRSERDAKAFAQELAEFLHWPIRVFPNAAPDTPR